MMTTASKSFSPAIRFTVNDLMQFTALCAGIAAIGRTIGPIPTTLLILMSATLALRAGLVAIGCLTAAILACQPVPSASAAYGGEDNLTAVLQLLVTAAVVVAIFRRRR